MGWQDGELLPSRKRWENAPNVPTCEHERGVVAPKELRSQSGASTAGRIILHCLVCDESWWEPLANIKGSPWAP